MSVLTIEDAKAAFSDIIENLGPGDEILITRDGKPIARILGQAATPAQEARTLGTLQGTVLYMAPDFDAPLEEFKEYME
jgi:prevent-host-death family protein